MRRELGTQHNQRATAPPGKTSSFPKVGHKSIHRGTVEEIVEAFITDSCTIGASMSPKVARSRELANCVLAA